MRSLLDTVVFVLLVVVTVEASVFYSLVGNSEDVASDVTLNGPLVMLNGGGLETPFVMQKAIDMVRGCEYCDTRIDVVVIATSDAAKYKWIGSLYGVDSVETIELSAPFQQREYGYQPTYDTIDGDSPLLASKIEKAEFVYFTSRSDSQCEFISRFSGTLVEAAVKKVYARGGGVGGYGAGTSFMGSYVFNGCANPLLSGKTALKEPESSEISFTYDFFNWNHLNDIIVEPNFLQRDRMGRLLTFLSRQIADGVTDSVWGLAINEDTSVIIEKNGIATVLGNADYEPTAYVVLADHTPALCENGSPLRYEDFKVWRLLPGDTFDLAHRPTDGFGYTVSVRDGHVIGEFDIY